MASHDGSYDEEGDPDNFLHLFEASKRSLRRHISQYISSSRRKEKALELSLLGFSGEHSWPLGEVPLEITLGDGSLTRTEVLNFVIIRSNSPHKLLLRTTAMHRMGIVVSTVHRATNFHTPNEIGTVLSTCEPPENDKGKKKSKATCSETMKNVLSCVDIEERIIDNTKYPEKTVAIGKQLPTNIKERLWKLLIANADVFAWTYTDMKRIPKTIIVGGKPFNTEHKLNEYKHIKPIKQKRRGLGSDCSEATERKNLKVYVDDMVIKSTSEEDMLRDIQETFDRFRLVNMKLNPKKCSFGVEEGLFLGHFITKQGIRANPSKVKAVTDLEPPRTLKEVQSLNGKLAALSRFLSKGAKKSLHFFKMLKTCTDKKTIRWTTYAEEAFQRMKELM
nr:reverse transcriptase domain-containing protein [Tanacetum cinerariifolium]